MFKRTVAIFFAVCFTLGVMCSRMAKIILTSDSSAASSRNSISVIADTSRGMIYDCNMEPLVQTEAQTYIALKPELSAYGEYSGYIPDSYREEVFEAVSSGKIALCPSLGETDGRDAVSFTLKKRYCDNGLCVHLVGYTDSSGGVCGIEKYYDGILSSASGNIKAVCSIDALRRPLKGEALKIENNGYLSPAGVQLTIDTRIQKICEDALEEFGFVRGAVAVVEVGTGEIKALVSVPEFNQNDVSKSLDDDNSPFVFRAIMPYSVGSVFKPVVAAAALESGIPTSLSYTCEGSYKIGENCFGCHKHEGHGTLDMYGGMSQSCNPYFINLALMTGADRICEMGERLGLGRRTELCDGWYAGNGNMPSSEELVSPQDLANLASGQGTLLASPLQMAAVYAAFADGGVYRAPVLMKAVIDSGRNAVMTAEPPAPRRVMKQSTAQTVSSLLLGTVNSGSGNRAQCDYCSVAGKTATAQSGQFKNGSVEITQSWFCGFFPYDAPKYSVAILKEDGDGGSLDCAPVFKYIADGIYGQGIL